VTLGFVLGLVTGGKIQDLKTTAEKKAFVFKRYSGGVLSAVSLAICANGSFGALLGQYGLAAAITIASGLLAASVGFQFYQFPAKYATTFGNDKAVFISLCDAFGFLMLAPFWFTISGIVGSNAQGWSTAWLVVASFLAVGGSIMVNSLATVMRLDEEKES